MILDSIAPSVDGAFAVRKRVDKLAIPRSRLLQRFESRLLAKPSRFGYANNDRA
ncbi:MAG: hypothetical protein JWO59_322 [Chloroflexi bacterium]|nr:hypothetical protein [Chloroflexota bacterium]